MTWLYDRFCVSFRDVEGILAKRGIVLSCETVRQLRRKFRPDYVLGRWRDEVDTEHVRLYALIKP